jgi:hypothetical protein
MTDVDRRTILASITTPTLTDTRPAAIADVADLFLGIVDATKSDIVNVLALARAELLHLTHMGRMPRMMCD